MSALRTRCDSSTPSLMGSTLGRQGFGHVVPEATGRPGYAPGDLGGSQPRMCVMPDSIARALATESTQTEFSDGLQDFCTAQRFP
jgi:hypothetical protein